MPIEVNTEVKRLEIARENDDQEEQKKEENENNDVNDSDPEKPSPFNSHSSRYFQSTATGKYRFPNLRPVTSQEAQMAFEAFASHKFCYSLIYLRGFQILAILDQTVFRYQLETLFEARSTAWEEEPFTGHSVDGPENGPLFDKWELQVEPTRFLGESKQRMPHTESLRQCSQCLGRGDVVCRRCEGRGRLRCSACHGTGFGGE